MTAAWYFAYGSNMQSATLRGRRGITFEQAMPGRAAGWRLVFDKPPLIPGGGAYANIIPDPISEVFGVLYQIANADLDHIDLTEGVLLGNYERIVIPVQPLSAPGERTVTAFTLTSERRHAGMQPSSRYMTLLIDGALEHGLPSEYIAFLRGVSTQEETPEEAELRPLIDEFMRLRRR